MGVSIKSDMQIDAKLCIYYRSVLINRQYIYANYSFMHRLLHSITSVRQVVIRISGTVDEKGEEGLRRVQVEYYRTF